MVSRISVVLVLLPAVAALQLHDSKAISSEVAKRCMKGDFNGATALLESRGTPIGWQHGKYMLMACFTDETGKCLLENARCAWLQRCLEEEGPCASAPIAAMVELPGGQVMLDELKADVNNSVTTQGQTRYKMKKILEVTKAMAESVPKEQIGSSFMQTGWDKTPDKTDLKILKAEQDLITTTFAPEKVALNRTMGKLAKKSRGIARVKWDLLASERSRKMMYSILTLPLFYLATCGMSDQGEIQGKDGKPIWVKFNPNGDGTIEYYDKLHKYKFNPAIFKKDGQFVCGSFDDK